MNSFPRGDDAIIVALVTLWKKPYKRVGMFVACRKIPKEEYGERAIPEKQQKRQKRTTATLQPYKLVIFPPVFIAKTAYFRHGTFIASVLIQYKQSWHGVASRILSKVS